MKNLIEQKKVLVEKLMKALLFGEFAKFVRPYEITDDTLDKWKKNYR